MECDFSGWATKASVKCSDGRTIQPDAFKLQHQTQVPLVWQHGHNDPENVLGHVLLENRDEGVYAYAFFNDTPKAKHAKQAVQHKDINHMSIWANQLVERAGRVLHGAIREVSLVLSGANPGAIIEEIGVRHSDGSVSDVDDAIIHTGLELEHSDKQFTEEEVELDPDAGGDGGTGTEVTDEDIEAFVAGEVQRQLADLHHADEDETIEDVYNSMSEKQKDVLHYMVGTALEEGKAEHSNLDDGTTTEEGKNEMGHNVFESGDDKGGKGAQIVLSHSDMETIVSDAKRNGSLKHAVEEYALAHGIENIDMLFPDAVNVTGEPELFGRRVEWVGTLMAGLKKSPFGRIKTLSADITVAEARAKGYITGTLKKEEFFKLARRITEPTTVYKKQKLDRDDMVDITEFDVVVWLKKEMRVMLDEEIARAVLLGDGRDPADADKINEEKIRPVALDSELYTTTVYVNIDDANSNMNEVADRIALNRKHLRGSGLPTFFTTETYIAMWLTQRDTLGRKIYKSLDELATDLRVKEIVPVEVMEEYPDMVGVIFNPADYTVGATAGGEVNFFDDFDIDYNQEKFLIETRCCGALTRMKSALVIRKVAAGDALVVPSAPTYNPETGEVTIVDTAGVVYRNADTDAVIDAAGSPYTVDPGETLNVQAEPAAGKYFESSEVDDWSFTNTNEA